MQNATSTITQKTKAALLVLQAAEMRGLPTPHTVRITGFDAGIFFVVDNRDEVVTWAEVLEADVQEKHGTHGIHCTAEGSWYSIPVTVVAVVLTEAKAVTA